MSAAPEAVPSPAPSTSLEAPTVIEVKAGVFKNTCLQLLDQVHDQQIEVVVTKRGEVVARVVAPEAQQPSAFGFLRGRVLSHGELIAPDFKEWGDIS